MATQGENKGENVENNIMPHLEHFDEYCEAFGIKDRDLEIKRLRVVYGITSTEDNIRTYLDSSV